MKKVIFVMASLLTAFSFSNCNKADKNIENEKVSEPKVQKLTKEEALKFAVQTRDSLIGNLQKEIAKGGTENAIEFCNLNAIPLTQKVADFNHAKIKRVSDQPRNQNNLANDNEKNFIKKYKEMLANNQEPKPEISANQLYVPIVTNAMCLQCHGVKEKDLKPATLAKLQKLYPEDKATGYTEKQIRGMFVVDLD